MLMSSTMSRKNKRRRLRHFHICSCHRPCHGKISGVDYSTAHLVYHVAARVVDHEINLVVHDGQPGKNALEKRAVGRDRETSQVAEERRRRDREYQRRRAQFTQE